VRPHLFLSGFTQDRGFIIRQTQLLLSLLQHMRGVWPAATLSWGCHRQRRNSHGQCQGKQNIFHEELLNES
jgi:hypothetical protein